MAVLYSIPLDLYYMQVVYNIHLYMLKLAAIFPNSSNRYVLLFTYFL